MIAQLLKRVFNPNPKLQWKTDEHLEALQRIRDLERDSFFDNDPDFLIGCLEQLGVRDIEFHTVDLPGKNKRDRMLTAADHVQKMLGEIDRFSVSVRWPQNKTDRQIDCEVLQEALKFILSSPNRDFYRAVNHVDEEQHERIEQLRVEKQGLEEELRCTKRDLRHRTDVKRHNQMAERITHLRSEVEHYSTEAKVAKMLMPPIEVTLSEGPKGRVNEERCECEFDFLVPAPATEFEVTNGVPEDLTHEISTSQRREEITEEVGGCRNTGCAGRTEG